ncbi:site-specific integrase [Nocardioides rubriscoriae]|uniref:site-specific integrase n=1 Tax=Nocardioides rubriscoriae TaxID=642762 RepID=UPI0011DFE5DD|nr:site-specific integrase [Nocardioides rubriscoriae]
MASISSGRPADDGSPRYVVNYRDPEGRQRRKTFRRKAEAAAFRNTVEADKLRGTYLDVDAGRISFRAYAEGWLDSRTFSPLTYEATELRLRLHVFPTLGHLELRQIKPSTIQKLLRSMEMAETYRRVIFSNVSAIFSAAVDDDMIAKNPCKASSVTRPATSRRKVVPWPTEWVSSMHDALPPQYRIAVTLGSGLGLRQGEVFGLAVEDVDFLRGVVEVRRQVKVFGGNRLVFGLPKGDKTRTVPLPESVATELSNHLATYPRRSITLPWGTPQADKKSSAGLILTTRERSALNRNYFNTRLWKPGQAHVGIEQSRDNGMHALRHWYASVLLDAGESIRAVSEYLGHSDPGFTLRTYTHLMPSSTERTRAAVDAAFAAGRHAGKEADTELEQPSRG